MYFKFCPRHQRYARKLLNDEYEELNDSSYSSYSNDMYSYSNDDSDISDIVSTVRGQF